MVEKVCERLKQLRENQNKTQDQMGEVIGVKQACYAAWERGDNEPPLEALIKICNCFKVSADWLLGIKDFGAPINVDAMRAEAGEAAEKLRRLVKQLEGMK